jgi:hypothetical protein
MLEVVIWPEPEIPRMHHVWRGLLLASWAVAATTLLIMVALVAASPLRPVYDEGWFLDTVRLLARDGVSLQFLHEFPGAAGPTFTLVFAAVDSLFGLSFPWLRLVNIALLVATAALVWRCLALTRQGDAQAPAQGPALTGAMLVVLPTAGVSAGMALTEMPAAFFAILAIALLAEALAGRGISAMACAALGGITLAAAILGRQNYLILLPCVVLAMRRRGRTPNRDDVWRVGLMAVITIALVTPVFVVWGGLVPQRTAWSAGGLAPDNVVRGAGYAGLILLLLAPRICAPLLRKPWLITLALAAIPLAFWPGDGFVPMRGTLAAMFGVRSLTLIAWAAAYLLSFAALAFTIGFARHLWRHRDHWMTRMSGAFVLLGLLSNAKITHQFSSRYVFIVLPFMIIAAAPAIRLTRWTPLQMTSAAGISLAALASYYFAR